VDLQFLSSTFSELTSESGLLFTVKQISNVTFDQCTFSLNDGNQAVLFYLVSNNVGHFFLNRSTISNTPALLTSSVMEDLVFKEDPTLFPKGASQIKVGRSTNVYINNTVNG
jgi:hypothetical protein